MLLIMLMYVLSGLMFVVLAIPMVKRKVRPNPWYGFRTRKTLSRADIWYKANEYSGRTLIVAGSITTLTALVFAMLPGISKDTYALLCLAGLLISLGWSVFTSFRYLSRLK